MHRPLPNKKSEENSEMYVQDTQKIDMQYFFKKRHTIFPGILDEQVRPLRPYDGMDRPL